jgi:hypothetical protein
LVEPVDEMENESWDTDLLDLLASDLADNGYNLKFTMEQIMTSHAYQLRAVNGAEQAEKDYVFRGPTVRRMTAEQFVDAVATLTGNWKPSPAKKVEFDGADLAGVTGGSGQANRAVGQGGDESRERPPQPHDREPALGAIPRPRLGRAGR